MPENVSFNQIPVDIRTPGQYIEIDNSRAVSGLPNMPRKMLVLGQRLSTGSVPAGQIVQVTSREQAIAYFGRGSQLAEIVAAARAANETSDIRALALDDLVAGVAATKTITVTGPATQTGILNLWIGGQRIRINIASGTAATAIATAINAAVNAALDLPVTSAVAGAVVTLTARHKGECGNAIDVRANYYADEVVPGGVGITVAAGTAGTGNPDVAAAIAAIGGDQFYTIVSPWTDSANLTALKAEMDARWGPMSQRTGHVFAGLVGTQSALAAIGATHNSPHLTFVGVNGSPISPWVRAAVIAAVCEASGSIDPARPFQTLPLPGLLPPVETARFTRLERDLLLRDGISTTVVDAGGNELIERVITTYQTNQYGVEDISYLDLEAKWTVDYIRYAVRARIALRYPRFKLANDGTQYGAGQAIVTPRVIRNELLSLFRELELAGLVENFEQFKRDLLVVRSNQDPNRVNAVIPPDIINQFRVFAAAVQFRL